MASSPLRPAEAAGSVPLWRVPKVLYPALFRSSPPLGHDYLERYKAERFRMFLAGYLAGYLYFGILEPLWEYIWVLRSPWMLAVVAVGTAQCVVLAAALRLVRRSRY